VKLLVEVFVHLRHLAARQVELPLMLLFSLPVRLLGIAALAVDRLIEVLGFHLLDPNGLIWRKRGDVLLHRHGRNARAKSVDVSREIMKHAETLSGGVDRHPRVRRQRAQVTHYRSPNGGLVLRHRVQRIDDDCGDISRRARRIFRPVRENARRDRFARRFHGRRAGRECRAFESEEIDRTRLAAIDDLDFILPQIDDRLSVAIGRDDGELHQGGARAK